MAKTAGTLSHTETAGFAKIIPPRIAGVSASRLVGHRRPVVRSAVPERLRAGERRGFFQRKSDLRISGEIGVAALFARAAVGDDIAAWQIGEIGRPLLRPLDNNDGRNIHSRSRGLPAGDTQRP